MSRTYLAAVMPAPNDAIELREFPEPELEPGSALLHTMYSEVCGTDIHLLHGKLAGVPYPIIPGHVSVGAVAKIRGSITRRAIIAITVSSRINRIDARREKSTASLIPRMTDYSADGLRRFT